MTQASWPSPNHNSRNVTDGEYERIAARFSDDGVDGSPVDAAVAAAGAGLQVVVRANVWASLRGHAWTSGTTDVTLTVAANSSGSTRTDRVVLRLDRSTWDVTAVVLPGTPGSGAPALTQDAGDTGVWEIPLAKVAVPDSATSVTVTREEQYIGSRVRPCTSTTRPAFPRRGELIQEVDTGRTLAWNGSVWELLHGDSGEIALGAPFSTWKPVQGNTVRKVGNDVRIHLWVERTGSTFTSTDLTGSKVGSVPAEMAPAEIPERFAAKFSGSGGNARVDVRPDGDIYVVENDSDVTPGRHLALTMTYLRM